MIFNSITFVVFLALVVALYWLLPRRPRLWMLFAASIVFYGFWRWEYVFLMLFSSSTDYIVALQLDRTTEPGRRRLLLGASLLVNLGLLIYFKYLVFFAGNAVSLLNLLGLDLAPPAWDIILPLGISFYTFQTVSYVVDVYRRQRPAEPDFVLYGCFVMYFPQLVAGPILRAGDIIDQLNVRPRFDSDDLARGLRRVVIGLFLKVALADNIASLVNDGFAQNPDMLRALDVWTLSFLFGFQIYFDFSAYSHIARGSAMLMGIHFPENFDFPYMATSPREFWRRWHISLSSWIRDYLYLPLCGVTVVERSSTGAFAAETPVSETRKSVALFLTWGIMGLWHGAAWVFVAWGLIHACLIYAHRKLAGVWRTTVAIELAGWLVTLPLVMLSWVAFRARSVHQMLVMYGTISTPAAYRGLGLRENTYMITALLMALIVLAYGVRRLLMPWLERRPLASMLIETPVLAVCMGVVFVFLRPINQFIYFQF